MNWLAYSMTCVAFGTAVILNMAGDDSSWILYSAGLICLAIGGIKK